MFKRSFILTAILTLSTSIFSVTHAQEKDSKLFMVSGYIQTDALFGEKDANHSVGELYTHDEINKTGKSFSRFGIRRGRIKGSFTKKDWSIIAQLNITENRVAPHTMMLQWSPDKWKGFDIRIGLQEDGFGLESSLSGKDLLGVERSQYITDLFRGNIDVCVSINYKLKNLSHLNNTGFRMGLMSGNNGGKMRKNKPDILLRLTTGHLYENKDQWEIGLSGYYGDVAQNDGIGSVDRQYIGSHFKLSKASAWGLTSLYGECITGKQPGQFFNNTVTGPAIKASDYFNPNYVIFSRKFLGAMGVLTHRFDKMPIELIGKYYYYDRNLDLSANEIAEHFKNNEKTFSPHNENANHVWGAGATYIGMNNALRITAYYEWMRHELIPNKQSRYSSKLNDNLMTIRLQYSF